jgi:hypothetical protein
MQAGYANFEVISTTNQSRFILQYFAFFVCTKLQKSSQTFPEISRLFHSFEQIA